MDQNPTAWTRNPPYRLLPGGTFFSRKGISNFSLVSRDASRNLIQKCQQISRRRKEREMRTKISSLGAELTPRGHWGCSFRADGPACPAPALPAPRSWVPEKMCWPGYGTGVPGATGPESQLFSARKTLCKTRPGDAAPSPPLPGRAWRGRHLPILQQTQACQQPIPPLPTAPFSSPLPGTSRTSQTPPRNPDKLQHKLPQNTILSSRSPIPAFLSVC